MIQDNLASVTEPNGVVTAYTYNSVNHLTGETVTRNLSPVTSHAYTLDNAGNRTGVTERQLLPNGTVNTRTVAYQYDNLYRLLFGERNGDASSFTGWCLK